MGRLYWWQDHLGRCCTRGNRRETGPFYSCFRFERRLTLILVLGQGSHRYRRHGTLCDRATGYDTRRLQSLPLSQLEAESDRLRRGSANRVSFPSGRVASIQLADQGRPDSVR